MKIPDLRGNENALLRRHIAKLILLLFGLIISITSIYLAVYWYRWHLAIIIFLALFGNNLERKT